MDPASLLEALAQAVRVGLVARDVFNAVRTLLDSGVEVTVDQIAGFRGHGASGSWGSSSTGAPPPDETTWSDAAQRPRRRRARRSPVERARARLDEQADIHLALGTEAF